MEPPFVTIGKILAPWGTQGKLRVEVITDFPQRFAPLSTVYVDRQPMTILSTQWHRGRAIIKVNSIDSIEDAGKLRGQLVEIPESQVQPLPEGQYYHFQLIGLEVWTTQEERLGKITEIMSAPSNDSYIVIGTGGEVLIPAIEDVVKSIDLSAGRLIIEPVKGLLTLNSRAAQ